MDELRAAAEKAIALAFSMGQTYWQQADSESFKQNVKANETLARYRTLMEETLALFAALSPYERQEAAAAGQGEREAFEAHARTINWPLDLRREPFAPDIYLDLRTETAWAFWQARASLPASPSQGQSAAARDVLAERQRQISAEGWTPEHDNAHADGSLACAASCYACAAAGLSDAERDWPWNGGFKVASPRRMLVKAGALILAEIERLDRAAPSQPAQGDA